MSKKVMVIDDEPEILGLLTEILEGDGYEVATCAEGRQAWDAVARFKPDLLILDVLLPGISGQALQERFSREPATKEIPIVVSSSLDMAKNIFVDVPQVVGFVTKPFKSESFLETVKSALRPSGRFGP